MKATLAAANKVESEANKALTGAMEAADAYHKVFFVKAGCVFLMVIWSELRTEQ